MGSPHYRAGEGPPPDFSTPESGFFDLSDLREKLSLQSRVAEHYYPNLKGSDVLKAFRKDGGMDIFGDLADACTKPISFEQALEEMEAAHFKPSTEDTLH